MGAIIPFPFPVLGNRMFRSKIWPKPYVQMAEFATVGSNSENKSIFGLPRAK